MVLAEPYRADDPTHRLVRRDRDAVGDAAPTGLLGVENRVVAIAIRYGSAVHLCLDSGHFEDARERLTRLTGSDRALENTVPEYRAELPAATDSVDAVLSVPEGDTAAWQARLFGLAELAVVADDTWLYRSVPHETHIREINADAAEGYLETLQAELRDVPATAIVPHGPVASWETEGREYTLTWDALRERTDGGGWRSVSLERLRYVGAEPERSELVFEWSEPAGISRVVRGLTRVFGGGQDYPPTRVGVPAGDVEPILDAFEDLRSRLAYDYEIVE